MAGVVNELHQNRYPLMVWAPDANPLLAPGIRYERLAPPRRFWDFREAPCLAFNGEVMERIEHDLEGGSLGWIYQRYSLHNFAGAWAAMRMNLPLVLEYNGSEVWMGEHWGSGLRWPGLANRIERLNLQIADLVVVVSEASRAELVARGVNAHKILVNPNGVDADRYSPDVAACKVRSALGWDGKTVIGFIGTFGRWHGAEVLVEAFARLCTQRLGDDSLRLLLIGDGPTRPLCEQLAHEWGVADRVWFPGLVAQLEGPQWLAACDVLVAPHVPNGDGSAFFGSPTKVFEYMAMQRPIVASRLGQLDELLRHAQTAWLVAPGDVVALADGLDAVLRDPAMGECMARHARQEVLEKYTWRAHTRRIVEKLQSLCG
jgi:glycosyltransferase involved in cell wall biosynthesis